MTPNMKHVNCDSRAHCVACRTDQVWREQVTGVAEFPCFMGVSVNSKGEIVEPKKQSTIGGLVNLTVSAVKAAGSVAKTSAGIDVASNEVVASRLAVCEACPGGHATHHPDGKLHTCGPMVESMKRAGQGTCGCVLEKKAKDIKQHCPFGWW